MTVICAVDGQRLLQGETVTTLQALQGGGELFDAVLTDPPYASGGLHVGARQQTTSAKYQQTDTRRKYVDFGGDARDQLSWQTWATVWLNLCRLILRPGSPVMMFCDWRQLGAATQAIQSGGFTFRGVVPWDKRNGRPQANRFRQQCEFIVWGSAGPMERPSTGGKYLPGLFSHTSPPTAKRRHLAQKPVALLRDLLQIVPAGGRVLDPFAGSASTLQACRELGLRGVAIEESAAIAADAAAWLRESSAAAAA